jgi:DNA polymerase III sliding clamp (beta) subunit (PCNA family)/exonuclease VII small subunit
VNLLKQTAGFALTRGRPSSSQTKTKSSNITMKHPIIELPAPELRHALAGLGKIIGRRTTLPVLSAVRVERNESGVVTLQGTDLDSTATFTLQDRSEGPATQLLVPFDRLQKAVRQSGEKVELGRAEKDQVLLRTFWRDTPMEEQIQSPALKEWPVPPTVDAEPVTLGLNVRDTLREAMECASTDESRAVINSVYLDVEENGHYVVATNGRHLFSANSFAFDFKKSVIIPTRKFLAWNGWWTEGEATLAIQAPTKTNEWPWLQLQAGRWTFLTRGVNENYPVWRAVVPGQTPKTTIVLPETSLASVLEVLARLPGGDDVNRRVKLDASSGTLVLSGQAKDQSQPASVPIIEAEVQGAPVTVRLNRDYVSRALRFGLNRLDIQDELTPVVFWSQGRRLIVMPLHPGTPGTVNPAATPPVPSPNHGPAAAPSAPPAETTTEPERKEMNGTTPAAPERGHPRNHATGEDNPAFKAVVEHIESIKVRLKETLNDLNQALTLIKAAEKEKRLNEKEMESVRATLRALQKVQI